MAAITKSQMVTNEATPITFPAVCQTRLEVFERRSTMAKTPAKRICTPKAQSSQAIIPSHGGSSLERTPIDSTP